MYSIMSGLAITAAGGGVLWYCIPRNGKPSPLAKIPLFDTVIPIAVVGAVTIGICLIVSGFF